MSRHPLHPLAKDYLQRLRRAADQLPPQRRSELLTEIEGHLADAIPEGASDEQALEVLERLGPPGEIVEAEQPPAPRQTEERREREWAAVILLPLGGFALGVGWLVGLALLWSSRLWTTRDKLIGTLVVPGGIAGGVALWLLIAVLTGTKRICRVLAMQSPSGAPATPPNVHCTPSGGPGAATTALHIALIAFFVLGPIVSAVYLARRAHAQPALAVGPTL